MVQVSVYGWTRLLCLSSETETVVLMQFLVLDSSVLLNLIELRFFLLATHH